MCPMKLYRGEPHTTVPELECIFAYTTLLGTLIEYGVSDTDRRGMHTQPDPAAADRPSPDLTCRRRPTGLTPRARRQVASRPVSCSPPVGNWAEVVVEEPMEAQWRRRWWWKRALMSKTWSKRTSGKGMPGKSSLKRADRRRKEPVWSVCSLSAAVATST